MSKTRDKLVMGVDPGIVTCGVVLMREAKNICVPHLAWTVDAKQKGHRNQFAQVRQTILRALEHRPVVVVCEEMTFFSSAKGRAAAANKTAEHLIWAYGRIEEMVVSRGIEFVPAPISTWKGTMSKELVKQRIIKRYEAHLGSGKLLQRMSMKSHDWDALGIALWHQGRF